jgi:taurine dioxygenase
LEEGTILNVIVSGQACGAAITGVDLAQPLDAEIVTELRRHWLEHHVLVFPGQPMAHNDLVRFVEYFGPIGDDPFIAPIDGHD